MKEYQNPLIPQRADPFLMRHTDGTYYFTASVPEYDRIELRAAKTVEELAAAPTKDIWQKHDSGMMSQHIWAPELHYVMGGWYLYFAASRTDAIWELRPYVLHCIGNDPMNDPWEECGQMQAAEGDPYSFTDFSLDATVFEHGGRWYYIWAEKVGSQHGISNLYIAEMESPVKLKTVQVLLTTPDYDWERVGFWVNEGPAVLKRNGRIFVTFSASATGACYCMGLLTADQSADLLDPRSWRKERFPVLCTDAKKGIYGPGHNSFSVAEDGSDLLVYHARPYEEIVGDPLYDPNRHAMIKPLLWKEDGTPDFQA